MIVWFQNQIQQYGEEPVRELMPLLVEVLETLNSALQDGRDLQDLKEENQQLMKQYETEKDKKSQAQKVCQSSVFIAVQVNWYNCSLNLVTKHSPDTSGHFGLDAYTPIYPAFWLSGIVSILIMYHSTSLGMTCVITDHLLFMTSLSRQG